jgi:hypothetical protein
MELLHHLGEVDDFSLCVGIVSAHSAKILTPLPLHKDLPIGIHVPTPHTLLGDYKP